MVLNNTYRNQWLGCFHHWCGRYPCPERFFSRPNSVCAAEVFNIYSQRAHGQPIKVGDKVGLYYPKDGKWFGCWQRCCGKYPCPGRPTYAYGFQHPLKWHHCGGETFQIFAYGKNNGEAIAHKDAIMLCYGAKWVSVRRGTSDKSTCPGHAPPNIRKYDQCTGEAFEIFAI